MVKGNRFPPITTVIIRPKLRGTKWRPSYMLLAILLLIYFFGCCISSSRCPVLLLYFYFLLLLSPSFFRMTQAFSFPIVSSVFFYSGCLLASFLNTPVLFPLFLLLLLSIFSLPSLLLCFLSCNRFVLNYFPSSFNNYLQKLT